MLKNASKILVLSLLMFASLGQAMGYSTFNSCQETNLVSNSDINRSNLNSSDITTIISYNNDLNINQSSNSNSKNETQDNCCNDDCCDNECVCMANGCTAAMYLNTVLTSSKIQVFNEPAYIHYLAKPRSINSAFYRPPIFIS